MAGPGPEAWRRGRDRAQAVGPAGLALPPSSAPRSPTQGGRSHGPPGPAVGSRRVSEVPEQDRGRPAPGPRSRPGHQRHGTKVLDLLLRAWLRANYSASAVSRCGTDENSGCFPKRLGNPLALSTMPEQSVRWPSATGSAVPPGGEEGDRHASRRGLSTSALGPLRPAAASSVL